MTRLDRYLLSQFLAIFGFFALILVSIYWVNRAVSLFEQLISDGQTALVVLEFTALTLPYVIRVVLPIAAFAATVYTLNRLSSESELVAMQATGASPWRLARPVLVFGLLVGLMMAVLTHFLVPQSRAQLATRQAQLAENVTASLLTPGRFQHPVDGISIYIRAISDNGELQDFYLWDSRTPTNRMSYLAKKAVIVRTDNGPKLVLFDGIAQSLRTEGRNLSVTRFSNFTYDLSSLIQGSTEVDRKLEQISSLELLRAPQSVLEETGKSATELGLELKMRFVQPLLAPVAALVGFAALMVGSFSRFGIWRQITLAVVILVLVQVLTNVTETIARSRPDLWPVLFAPAAVGVLASLLLLHLSARRKFTGRRLAAKGAA
ncbi:LPS export ABC transporter permease LptF [Thioclava sp. GXIMD4216]|uniref:LPS export ABC transporter permease LptF n=1 Tax=unclassified Thioclava TaxID=2621713 RepID=UPI0030CE726F